MILVDAHEDLAWNMLTFGRDYTRSAAETRALEAETEAPSHNGNTLLGWEDWVRGRVALVFATLFAAPERRRVGAWESLCYRDSQEAYALYTRELDAYHRLVDDHPDKFRLILSRSDLEQVLEGWRGDPPIEPRLGLVVLMEGADGVRAPAELEAWFQRGVRILGPAWAGTRYAGGTGDPGPFTEDGLALLQVMAELGMILDLSHLAEQAALQALDGYPGAIIASHCNARALIRNPKYPERHLSDDLIRLLAEREGVIGVVPYNRFLVGDWSPSDGRQRIGLDMVVAQIDHICQLAGDAGHVGLGTDFDGGFGVEAVPTGLDTVADLRLIGDALRARGYAPEEVQAVLGDNWLRLLRGTLPES